MLPNWRPNPASGLAAARLSGLAGKTGSGRPASVIPWRIFDEACTLDVRLFHRQPPGLTGVRPAGRTIPGAARSDEIGQKNNRFENRPGSIRGGGRIIRIHEPVS